MKFLGQQSPHSFASTVCTFVGLTGLPHCSFCLPASLRSLTRSLAHSSPSSRETSGPKAWEGHRYPCPAERFVYGTLWGKQGFGPKRGQSPVEHRGNMYICTSVGLSVCPSSRPTIAPAWARLWRTMGQRGGGRRDVRTDGCTDAQILQDFVLFGAEAKKVYESNTIYFPNKGPPFNKRPHPFSSRNSEKRCLHYHNWLISRADFVRKKAFFHPKIFFRSILFLNFWMRWFQSWIEATSVASFRKHCTHPSTSPPPQKPKSRVFANSKQKRYGRTDQRTYGRTDGRTDASKNATECLLPPNWPFSNVP